MNAAFAEAERALARGEVPIGACFVVDGALVAEGSNETNETCDPTRHAELVAVDRALASGAAVPWARCEVFVNCEPCIMCAGALAQLGVRRVVYGCANDRFGGGGSLLGLHAPRAASDLGFACVGGVQADRAVALLKRFYARGNERTTAKEDEGGAREAKRARKEEGGGVSGASGEVSPEVREEASSSTSSADGRGHHPPTTSSTTTT